MRSVLHTKLVCQVAFDIRAVYRCWNIIQTQASREFRARSNTAIEYRYRVKVFWGDFIFKANHTEMQCQQSKSYFCEIVVFVCNCKGSNFNHSSIYTQCKAKMLNKDSVLAGFASSFVGNWVLPFSPKMSEKPAKRCVAMTRFFWLRFWCSLRWASFSSCFQLYHDLVLFWQKASCQVSPCTHKATALIKYSMLDCLLWSIMHCCT